MEKAYFQCVALIRQCRSHIEARRLGVAKTCLRKLKGVQSRVGAENRGKIRDAVRSLENRIQEADYHSS